MDDAVTVWPDLPYASWRETAATLQLWTQIVGKVRLTLTPWLNHGCHEFAVVDELGPTWRAARSPGVGPPDSSVGLITAVDRVWPAGDSASSPVPHHASSRPA